MADSGRSKALRCDLAGQELFVTDNTQVMAALNSGRSRNKTTMAWLRLIFWAFITYNFDIQSVYINSRSNIICNSVSRLNKF